MRKARLLSLFAVGSLSVTLICMSGILAGQADERMDGSVPAIASPFAILHSFAGHPNDGASPFGSLAISGTTLYGMTGNGGANGLGAIFKFDTTKNVLTVLHSFAGGTNDGDSPVDSLTLSGTILYGMTYHGGANGLGTIFKFDTTKNVLTVLHGFAGGANDGASPSGSLTLSGTTLYGMTRSGGAGERGTIFKFDTTKNVITVLHSFAGAPNDGASPYGTLSLSGTTLYGMTLWGGAGDWGTIFKFDTTKNVLTVMHSFAGRPSDGQYPYGSLALSGTTLYGMTFEGSAGDQGTIFKCDTTTGLVTFLHNFAGGASDGQYPYYGSLTLSGTTLYGMTFEGGAGGKGTIFKLDTTTDLVTVLHGFAGGANDGASPYGSLTLSGTTLYGMTFQGGANNLGAIFSMPSGPLYTIAGIVTSSAGPAMPGVTVTLSQPKWSSQTTTSQSGAYSFFDLTPGNYVITPSLTGYVFTPNSISVSVKGRTPVKNFTCAPVTISGAVTFNGAPVTTNLTINLSGKASGAYSLDASGDYMSGPLANGSYKVTPTIKHPSPAPKASPSSATIVINGKSVTQNFTYIWATSCGSCHRKLR